MTSLNMRKMYEVIHNAYDLVDDFTKQCERVFSIMLTWWMTSLNMRKSILHNADLVDDFTKHAKEYSP